MNLNYCKKVYSFLRKKITDTGIGHQEQEGGLWDQPGQAGG
jgi:hypothetical protein